MSSMDLEDRLSATLQRWADDVTAPPSTTARDRVSRRTGQLQRRRQVGRALGCAALAIALAGGGVWALSDPPAPVETINEGPESDDAPLPMFTIDGLVTTGADDTPEPAEWAGEVQPLVGQTFRETGNYAGPTLWLATYGRCFDRTTLADLESTFAPDVLTCWGQQWGVPDPAAGTDVTIGDRPGRVWDRGSERALLVWLLDDDSAAVIQARALTHDDLVAFANGLVLRPDGDSYDATVLPAGISEQLPGPVAIEAEYLRHEMEDEAGQEFGFLVFRGGAPEFEQALGPSLNADAVEQIEVLGRPAVMETFNTGYDGTPRINLLWRHTDDVMVMVGMPGMDRASVDAVIARMHEIDGATWQQLLESYPYEPYD